MARTGSNGLSEEQGRPSPDHSGLQSPHHQVDHSFIYFPSSSSNQTGSSKKSSEVLPLLPMAVPDSKIISEIKNSKKKKKKSQGVHGLPGKDGKSG
jgi:hypothetical protein